MLKLLYSEFYRVLYKPCLWGTVLPHFWYFLPGEGNLIHVTLWPLFSPSLSLPLKNKGSSLPGPFLLPLEISLPAERKAWALGLKGSSIPVERKEKGRPRSWNGLQHHIKLHLIKTGISSTVVTPLDFFFLFFFH